MKDIKEYIINEASTTSFVNKIKNEFKKEFGDKVTLTSAKANFTQLYDIYIYDENLETLKKVNEILKKHLTLWKGFTDEELKNKIDEHNKFMKEYGEKYPWKDSPIEFFRFTSRDVKKILNQ